MTRALVVGGGIAGPVCAMALQRAGIAVQLFEGRDAGWVRTPQGRGAWLTLAVNGLDALRALDDAPSDPAATRGSVRADVDGVSFPSTEIELRSGTGKSLGRVPLGGTLADGTVTRTVTRGALEGVLRAAAEARGISTAFGRRLVAADVRPDGVVARFADGTEVEGDLLVGADGVHSRVRSLIDPGAPPPRFRPLGNVAGYLPADVAARLAATEPAAPDARFVMTFGRQAFFGHVVRPTGELWWFANPPSARPRSPDELDALSSADGREALARLFDDDAGPAAGIIRATATLVGAANTYDLPAVPRWWRERLVLVGDAAHAVSPTSGQGASLAIEDAIELARCLRDLPDLTTALATYERLRRPRVERIVRQAARIDTAKVPGVIARTLRDLLLPWILRRPVDAAQQRWLYHHRIPWDRRVC